MAGAYKFKDPFVQGAFRVWSTHYKGKAPGKYQSRVSGQLNKSPEGRRLVGAMAAGDYKSGLDYLKLSPKNIHS